MGRRSKIQRHRLTAASHARLSRSYHRDGHQEPQPDPIVIDNADGASDDDSDDNTECSWPGGVNNHLQIESELLEENWIDSPEGFSEVDGQSEEEDEDLCDQEGEELRNSLEECVKDFSSRKYTSHRHVPETLARLFDV